MDQSQIVLQAIIDAFKSDEEVLDMMETVNANAIGISEEEFSESLYKLQQDGMIFGVCFEPDNPKKVTLWDAVGVSLPQFRTN